MVLVLLFSAGCQGPSYSKPPGSNDTPKGLGLELAVEERVTIRFAGIPNPPPVHEERIRADGTIHPPFLSEPIKAAGLTPQALRDTLHQAYVPRIFSTISITVLTEDRLFTLSGEVNRPGRYPYIGETTAVEAISQAGGLTDFARKRRISITRVNGTQLEFDFEKARRDSRFDPPIYPSDIIDVPRRHY